METPKAPTPKEALVQMLQKALENADHGTVLDTIDRLGETKPGLRTTEFWLSVIASALGAYLIAVGKPLEGAMLGALATVSYNLSRGLAKKA